MKYLLKRSGVKSMNSLFTVIGFTFRNKVKSKAFIITSVILVVLLSVVINLPYIIQSFSSDEPKKIGIFEDGSAVTQMLKSYIDQQEEKDFTLVLLTPGGSPQENDELIKDSIVSGAVDGFLEFHSGPKGSFPAVVYKSEDAIGLSSSSS